MCCYGDKVTNGEAKCQIIYGTANFMQQTMTVAPGAMIYCAPEALTPNQTVKVSFLEFRAFLIQHCFINTF